MSGADYGREALDFIEELNGHNEVPVAMNALEHAFCRFGFETIIVTRCPIQIRTSPRWCWQNVGPPNGSNFTLRTISIVSIPSSVSADARSIPLNGQRRLMIRRGSEALRKS